jgi:hypothetical protein
MSTLTPGGPLSASGEKTERDLPQRARTIGVVMWCSFLAAAGGTTVLFAFLDPSAFQRGIVPAWWADRHTVYALGFFLFWLVAACSAALTIYMAHTDRATSDGSR